MTTDRDMTAYDYAIMLVREIERDDSEYIEDARYTDNERDLVFTRAGVRLIEKVIQLALGGSK